MAAQLVDRLLAVHAALDAHHVKHAFGGAIALAFYTLEPRGTRDLDVNIFVDQRDAAAALAALPPEVPVTDALLGAVLREGQARLWWQDTPVDVFFDNLPVHRQAARHVRSVPFAGTTIPILGPIELVVFKAMFDRTKDWADIEAVVAAGELDIAAARQLASELTSSDARLLARFDDAVRRGQQVAAER